MKFLFFILLFSFFVNAGSSQKIIGAAMLDEKENTTSNEKKAKYLIVLKKYNDTTFEKLDYNFAGPLQRRMMYRDSLLTSLNGSYADFREDGFIYSDGKYINNKKEGSWYVYDDTAHAKFEYKYHLDSLTALINLDSLSEEKKKIKDTINRTDAEYKGGNKKLHYLYSNFKMPERTQSVNSEGEIRVRFIISEDGKPIKFMIIKSLEFAADEEALRVTAMAKDWIPATENGKKIEAGFILPFKIDIR
ncbi:MAG TPA: energy transducer TonB [Chitinophagaceae bacterium]|nr:energy transducer TonB [Chitinophagaceae bacterium]